MRMLSHQFCLALAALSLLTSPSLAQPAKPQGGPTRITTAIPSAQRLLDDLEWVVGGLAGEQSVWKNTLYPSAEVFLIGVDRERPFAIEQVFDRAGGQRKQFQVPLSDLNEFRTDNLEPIDIQSRRREPDLYELTSKALGYKGWMRIIDNYASISEDKEDVPAGMVTPRTALDQLFKKPTVDAALSAQNDAAGMSDRRQVFQQLRENMLSAITRRPDETREAFDLRQNLAKHQVQRLERLFVESERLLAGWTTDTEKAEAFGELSLSAIVGTELAQVLSRQAATASYFAAVPIHDDALVTGRAHITFDDSLQTQADEFYKLAAPVWKQRIDGDQNLSDVEKAARKKITDLFLSILHDGRSVQAIDGFINVTPTAAKTYVFLGGIRAADGTKAIEILKLIPEAIEGLVLELNVGTAGPASIHRIKITGKLPDALKSFYGEEGAIYVATQPEAVWMAAGSGSLDVLKETIALVQSSQPQPDGRVLYGRMRLGPVVKHLDDLAVETGFNPQQFLGREAAAKEQADKKTDDRGVNPAQALAGFDWRGIALPVLLKSTDDHLTILVRQENGVLNGSVHVERGVLNAAGKVIAKVAEEKLGGG